MAKLTDKQRAFVAEYLIDLNATQAAIRAGYSKHTARQIAASTLSKVYIQEAIAEAMSARQKRTEVTADRVVKELARLAFSDMRDFVAWQGERVVFKDSDQLADDDAAAVTEVKAQDTQFGTTLSIKLGHKDSALKLLAEHMGITGGERNTNVNVNVNTEVAIEERRQRFDQLYDALDAAGRDTARAEANGNGGTSHRGEPLHPNGSAT